MKKLIALVALLAFCSVSEAVVPGGFNRNRGNFNRGRNLGGGLARFAINRALGVGQYALQNRFAFQQRFAVNRFAVHQRFAVQRVFVPVYAPPVSLQLGVGGGHCVDELQALRLRSSYSAPLNLGADCGCGGALQLRRGFGY